MIEITETKHEYINIEFSEYKNNIKDLINILNKYKEKYKIEYLTYNMFEQKKPFYIKITKKGKKWQTTTKESLQE